ncbi:MAG: transposase [Xanthomonadales bacterium]|nr:transposase [Xanthomonadales bacterium]
MYYDTHSQARTTAAVREQIQQAKGKVSELARRFGVSEQTIRKWRRRDTVHDRSHRPDQLQTSLNGSQENLVILLRQALRLPLDDLLALTCQWIQPRMSRSALDRSLRRRGASRLAALRPQISRSSTVGPCMAINVLSATAVGLSSASPYLMVAAHPLTRWTHSTALTALDSDSLAQYFTRLSAEVPFQLEALVLPNGTLLALEGSAAKTRQGWQSAARSALTEMPTWTHWRPGEGRLSGRSPSFGEPLSQIVKPAPESADGCWTEPVISLLQAINRQALLPCLNRATPQHLAEQFGASQRRLVAGNAAPMGA